MLICTSKQVCATYSIEHEGHAHLIVWFTANLKVRDNKKYEKNFIHAFFLPLYPYKIKIEKQNK